ncbi:VTT domain-containing protein [Demequina sp. TTPB684]|uniref:DedA family protein n=1 Tax=unclassified Demequina TaxID=2620311 RepID=UPI001CF25EFB|nr:MULTISPECIES: VTT domain-containing protein [unclassified Demequina]MCB2412940.1 VTT domain-containing protein [Demequina sp. TTPB684]UPU88433.1 VTT domain-containing protein [Demequina sp. TMPB413]
MSGFWDWLVHLSSNVEHGILELVDSLWIYPAVFAVSVIDAIFPVVPSESVIIGAASAWQSVGQPILPLLFLAGAAGAWCGDQTAYFIGTKVDVRHIKLFRRPRILAALDWAEHSLETRGTLYIIAARFIPMGRVAVNLSAGALGFPRRRFMAIDAVAVTIWAAWGILIGTVAASLFEDNLLLSIAAGITGGVVLGFAVDKVMSLAGLSSPELPPLAEQIEADESLPGEESHRD